MLKTFTKLFKRKHPYAVAAYVGRKNAQRILDCKIEKKLSRLVCFVILEIGPYGALSKVTYSLSSTSEVTDVNLVI